MDAEPWPVAGVLRPILLSGVDACLRRLNAGSAPLSARKWRRKRQTRECKPFSRTWRAPGRDLLSKRNRRTSAAERRCSFRPRRRCLSKEPSLKKDCRDVGYADSAAGNAIPRLCDLRSKAASSMAPPALDGRKSCRGPSSAFGRYALAFSVSPACAR